eukprot:scaffold13459_cov89-Skeletonema_menzelii.AAC.1
MKTEETKNTTTTAEGDTVNLADGILEEEEKIEEDAVVNHLAETQPGSSSSNGKLKTPEGERDDIEVTSDALRSNRDATSSSRKGTIAEIPNINSAQEDAAVSENGSDVVPAVMFIAGPDYTGRGIFTGYQSGSDDDDDTNINEAEVIIQGFLPEDDPRRKKSNHEILEERVQRLIDNAITLDDSAVQPIPLEEDGDEEENVQSNSSDNDDEVEESNKPRWFLLLLGLATAVCIVLAIALPLSLRGEPDNSDTSASL